MTCFAGLGGCREGDGMWASKSYVSNVPVATKNELGGQEIEIVEGVCRFNTVRDAPAGSPLSRVASIVLVPSHIRPTPLLQNVAHIPRGGEGLENRKSSRK